MSKILRKDGTVMKDHRGSELSIGDKVAFVDGASQYAHVQIGTIHRVTDSGMFINAKRHWELNEELEYRVPKNRPRRILKIMD